MKIVPLIFVFILILKSSMQNDLVENEDELCGGSCYKVIKPVLELLPELQKELQECRNQEQESKKLVLQSKELLELQSQLQALEKLLADIEMDPWMTKCTKPPRENTFCENINGKHYFVDYLVIATWEEAYNICRNMGGHLVSLQSEKEWAALPGETGKGNGNGS
ncbi:uncharacterized protein Dana_GF26786 [Drosophila ananassae]|uniref:C-type lectin domain-containing protein n=1 Tax=Drosophila ananassae TaxID=7217 RepID=A0A0N8NZ87_DROAN|nr:uncharacterized protein Dana_GF26786 [Drosophila ananassae]